MVKMLKYILLLGLTVLVAGGKSPNSDFLEAYYTAEQLQNFPDEVLEDAKLDVPDLIAKYGYPVESHEVQTDDGYVLTMHRIPHGKNDDNKADRIPVFLMHGLTASSSSYVIARPERGLAYILADAGYDVWMGNARGNYYSRKHVEKDPESRRFWMFSWNEIGRLDLPAMIDYVLATNGHSKLHYVGHSQGTTSFFVMASSRPDYNSKIITMQAFAPVAYMGNLKNRAVGALAKYADGLQIIITLLGMNEFLSKRDFYADLIINHCGNEESPFFDLCHDFLVPQIHEQTNSTIIPVYLGHTPAGASSRQFVHYGQLHLSGQFRQYDHGSFGNIAVYGRMTPPRYPLGRITAPVALHYSLADTLADPVDIYRLAEEIVNPIGLYRVPLDTFSHMHFVTAIDVRELLYDQVMEIMKNHE